MMEYEINSSSLTDATIERKEKRGKMKCMPKEESDEGERKMKFQSVSLAVEGLIPLCFFELLVNLIAW